MVAQHIRLPNIRRLFAPDPGKIIFDADLQGADAQIVAWEAGDERLKEAFRQKKKVHIVNARDMWPDKTKNMTDDEIKNTEMYPDIKRAVHGTNYGGGAPGLAETIKWSVKDAIAFQERWFFLNPGIKAWHERTERFLFGQQCWSCRAFPEGPRARCDACGAVLGATVKNQFGYRRKYFERVEGLLPAALAWGPQSSVAFCTEIGWMNLFQTPEEIDEIITTIFGQPPARPTRELIVEPDAAIRYRDVVQALLQVHDSFVGQLPKELKDELPKVVDAMRVRVPYPEPLVIGMGYKWSETSWGEC